jgi:hypothetical protein
MERLLDSEAWRGSVAATSLSSSAVAASKPGPFDIEVERLNAFEAAERPRAIGLEGVKVSDRGQKSQAACAFFSDFCPLSLTLAPSKQGWSGCSTARPGGALSLPPA